MLSENLPALTAALENQNVAVKNVTVIDPSDAASQMGFAFTSQNSGSERDNSADNHKKPVCSLLNQIKLKRTQQLYRTTYMKIIRKGRNYGRQRNQFKSCSNRGVFKI